MNEFLPYSRQIIDEDDIAAVTQVLRSDFLTTGDKVPEFELALQNFMNVPHALCVNSGTAALHLAWRALELPEGAKVICPAITFLSAAATAHHCGLEVIFADCDPDTGLMNAETISQAAGDDTGVQAVCVVHLNGQFAPMTEIKTLADARGWKIIEDACHSIGGMQNTQKMGHTPSGSCHFSDITVFSLHAVKNITTGEGGIVTCKDDASAQKMRDWRSHGIIREDENENARFIQPMPKEASRWYHEMQQSGYNYRMTDFQAALGISQLKKLPHFIDKRQQIHAVYQRHLGEDDIGLQLVTVMDTGIAAWHLCVLLIDFAHFSCERSTLMQALYQDGIGTQLHYIPLYRQPFFKQLCGQMSLAGAESYYQRALSVPLFPLMQEQDVTRILSRLKHHLGHGT